MESKYCENCGEEILDINDKHQMDKALLQSLLLMCGAKIIPPPTYCQCGYANTPERRTLTTEA